MDYNILTDLIITKIYSATTMYTEENAKTKRVNRPRWAIVIKYEGETKYFSNGETVISNINNIVILPKGLSYEWLCTKEGHFSIIEFEADANYDKILTFPVSNGEKILKSFKELEYKRTLKNPLYKLECIKEIYSLILKLLETAPKTYLPTSKQTKIQPAIDYIVKNYNKNIKNDELAALTSLSTVYFRKLFTDIFEMSPITYIHSLRIKKAKEMLKSDYSSISDIAQSLGYSNIYDFSRTFKKYTGISPSKYSNL